MMIAVQTTGSRTKQSKHCAAHPIRTLKRAAMQCECPKCGKRFEATPHEIKACGGLMVCPQCLAQFHVSVPQEPVEPRPLSASQAKPVSVPPPVPERFSPEPPPVPVATADELRRAAVLDAQQRRRPQPDAQPQPQPVSRPKKSARKKKGKAAGQRPTMGGCALLTVLFWLVFFVIYYLVGEI